MVANLPNNFRKGVNSMNGREVSVFWGIEGDFDFQDIISDRLNKSSERGQFFKAYFRNLFLLSI